MVFQDPNESLNPRFSIRRTLREPLRWHGNVRIRRTLDQAILRVNLEPET